MAEKPVAFLHTHNVSGQRELTFTDMADLPYNRKNWTSAALYASPVKWHFCPECGCEEVHYEEGRLKQCAGCGQEWFSDLDYRDVTAKNLRRLFAARQESRDLRAAISESRSLADFLSVQKTLLAIKEAS